MSETLEDIKKWVINYTSDSEPDSLRFENPTEAAKALRSSGYKLADLNKLDNPGNGKLQNKIDLILYKAPHEPIAEVIVPGRP